MTTQRLHNARQTLRSGIAISPAQTNAINRIINDLLHKVPAHLILLTDVTGQIVLVRGQQDNINLVALGSLVAGDLAASQEIARLTGEYNDYQLILREGHTKHSFILAAGLHLALLVQVSNQVPLGWARMLIKTAACQLADALHNSAAGAGAADTFPSIPELDQNELPDLFNDALDSLWSE